MRTTRPPDESTSHRLCALYLSVYILKIYIYLFLRHFVIGVLVNVAVFDYIVNPFGPQ